MNLSAAERALIEMVRSETTAIHTVIAYTRYHGKALLERSTSDYETEDGRALTTFADRLEAAHDVRRAHP
ncbi:hypothetical protein [Brevibacillus agri]|uniref:hypothetical protein n=1 Tax=Brevibacillus agri TaxID=51101 RepID=UPI003D2207C5